MTFTTASGLLPAGIAVYVQRGPNGVHMEIRYLIRLQGFTSKRRTSEPNRERPAWEYGRSGAPQSAPRTFRSHDLQTAQPLVRFLLMTRSFSLELSPPASWESAVGFEQHPAHLSETARNLFLRTPYSIPSISQRTCYRCRR
jgi:hypothetical protein